MANRTQDKHNPKEDARRRARTTKKRVRRPNATKPKKNR